MHRIDHPTKAVDLHGGGKHGFTEGAPVAGVAPTTVTDDILNAFQEEIAGVVEDTGVALVKADNTQLADAINLKRGEAHAFLLSSHDGAEQASFTTERTIPGVDLLFPANSLLVGDVHRYEIMLAMATGTSPLDYDVAVQFSAAPLDIYRRTIAASATADLTFWITGGFRVKAVGGAGVGKIQYWSRTQILAGTYAIGGVMQNGSVDDISEGQAIFVSAADLNTTVAQTLRARGSFGTSSAGNKMQVRMAAVDRRRLM